jgi:hypothetical protein
LDSFRLILLSTLIGGMAGATVLAGVLDQVGIVTDALTGAGIGALLGNTVAHRRRHGHVSVSLIMLRWTWLGAGLAVLAHLVLAAIR